MSKIERLNIEPFYETLEPEAPEPEATELKSKPYSSAPSPDPSS